MKADPNSGRAQARKKRSASPSRSSSLRPLPQLNRVQGTVEQLQQQIIAGTYGLDGLLPSEMQLAQAMGVSRTVIREAMRILGAQGLVEVSQGRVSRVKRPDPQVAADAIGVHLLREGHLMEDLIEVRRFLETAIAALAADRATPEHIQRLEQNLALLESLRELDRQIEADLQFHNLLAEATGNPVFQILLKALEGPMLESRKRTFPRSGVERSLAGHRNVLAALKRRDSNAARQAMLEHLSEAERDLSKNR
jgi:GntR family transcriptional regulator, transcriptional repressor for pyruvate dehydrogenase complex